MFLAVPLSSVRPDQGAQAEARPGAGGGDVCSVRRCSWAGQSVKRVTPWQLLVARGRGRGRRGPEAGAEPPPTSPRRPAVRAGGV